MLEESTIETSILPTCSHITWCILNNRLLSVSVLNENVHFMNIHEIFTLVFSLLRWTMTPETLLISALKVLFPPQWQTSGR